jgi:hypothetical protein
LTYGLIIPSGVYGKKTSPVKLPSCKETRTDHIRMLALAMAFVKAQWKNRERRMIFDETQTFTGAMVTARRA